MATTCDACGHRDNEVGARAAPSDVMTQICAVNFYPRRLLREEGSHLCVKEPC